MKRNSYLKANTPCSYPFMSAFIFSIFFFVNNSNSQTPAFLGWEPRCGVDFIGRLFLLDADANQKSTLHEFEYQYAGSVPLVTTMIEASNGKLYGTTDKGGDFLKGVLFEFDPNNGGYTILHDFKDTDGVNPSGTLLQASNGKLYGMTIEGGDHNKGVFYEFDLSMNLYSKVIDFDGANGGYPNGISIIQASNGVLYGMTTVGGSTGNGVIFSYDIPLTLYTVEHNFILSEGANPTGPLTEVSNNMLYGVTRAGGNTDNDGTIFSFDFSTKTYTKLYNFSENTGKNPCGGLAQAPNGKLYGMTRYGGLIDGYTGVIYEYNPVNYNYSVKYTFNGFNGSQPDGMMALASDGKFYGFTRYGGLGNGDGVIFQFDYVTGIYKKKLDFKQADNSVDARYATGSFVQSSNGLLYAMSSGRGVCNQGFIFSYDLIENKASKLLDFDIMPDGGYPLSGMILADNEKYYGVAAGGAYDNGVLYEWNHATGQLTKKHDFVDSYPTGLMKASNGLLYGLTSYGGLDNDGTLFEYNVSTGIFTKKYEFQESNGANPVGTLVEASNGKLYGFTQDGGSTNNWGVIFEFDPVTNAYVKKVDFTYLTGGQPGEGSMIEIEDNKLLGATPNGGTFGKGEFFEYDINTNTFTIKFSFSNEKGTNPKGRLIKTDNKKVYGLTKNGGSGLGVLYEFDYSSGTYTTKHEFITETGMGPASDLVLASNGKIYGTTWFGGEFNQGTLFEFDYLSDTYNILYDFYDETSCGSTSGLIEVGEPTDIKTRNQKIMEMEVMPVPFKDEVNIHLKNLMPLVEKAELTLIGNMGNTIYQEVLSISDTFLTRTLDLRAIPPGFYFVRIKLADVVLTKKVIKN